MNLAKEEVGKVTHFFNKINVAVIELSAELKVGEKISIEGHGNAFEQNVDSMEIDRNKIESASAGQAVGMKTGQPVKEGDIVYKVTGE